MGGSSNVQQPQQPASGKGPSQPQQPQQGQQTSVPQNVLNSYSQQQQSSYGQPQGYYGRQQFQPQPQPQQQFQQQPQQQQPQQQQPQQQQPQQQQAGYYGQSGSSQQPQNMLNQFMQAQQMGGMQPATGKGAQQGPGQLGGSQQAATFSAGRANPEQMFNDFNAARMGQPGQGSQQAVAPSTNGAGIPPDVMDRYNQANPQQAEGQFGQFNQQQRQDAAMQAAQQAQNPMFNQFQQQQQQGLPPTASGKGASQLRGGMFSRGGYAGGGDVAPPGMSLLMMERNR